MKTRILPGVLWLAGTLALPAAPLTQSTFTEIVKQVNVVAATTKAATPAQLHAVVQAPDLVRTGPESRAELTAPDQTLTRVGANTVFAFDTAGRSMDLPQGSVLFHSPKGKGGGTIRSGGAAAAVLGTTIIVAAMPGGGFKVIVLEGKGQVTFASGRLVTLAAGQLVFVRPGDKSSKVLDINLAKLIQGSLLVTGFAQELPSLPLILRAIETQNILLTNGRATDTGIPADQFAWRPQVNLVDNVSWSVLLVPEGQAVANLGSNFTGELKDIGITSPTFFYGGADRPLWDCGCK